MCLYYHIIGTIKYSRIKNCYKLKQSQKHMKLENHLSLYRKYILALGFLCSINFSLLAQQIGFDFPEGVESVKIPFERYNNLIVIPIKVNNTITIKFILDSGVQFAILTEKSFGEFLNLKYDRELSIQGPGMADSIRAQVANNIKMTLPGDIKSGINQSLLVLEEEYLSLRKNLGADVYGIIGYDIFSRFVVEINYDKKYIVLHEPKHFKPKKKFRRLPLTIESSKPYIYANLIFDDGKKAEMNLMVDTGASHPLLLDNNLEDITLPLKTLSTVIGRGLGGDIMGELGRINNVSFSTYEFDDPIVSFPIEGQYSKSMKKGSRNGTIGGEILTRFNPIFDYNRGILYLTKSKEYYKKFEHDMSGLDLQMTGSKLDVVEVIGVREDSPAKLAGVEVGDIITNMNGADTKNVKFSDITSTLRYRPKKNVHIKVMRNDTIHKISFKLQRMI